MSAHDIQTAQGMVKVSVMHAFASGGMIFANGVHVANYSDISPEFREESGGKFLVNKPRDNTYPCFWTAEEMAKAVAEWYVNGVRW